MTAYDLTVKSWDGSTRLFDVELSDADAALLSRVSGLVDTAARRPGQPGLEIAVAECRPESGVCDECFDPFGPTDVVSRNWLGEWIHHACLGGAA